MSKGDDNGCLLVDNHSQDSLSQEYIYRPLQSNNHEIRLLELMPGEDSSIVQVRLIHSTLSNSHHEALSYTWGDPLSTKPIEILPSSSGGSPDRFIFYATANLASALRNLRYSDDSRILWVDAICVNQRDNVEKAFQVRQMGIIFQRASRVVVYLGEEADYSNEVMHLIAQEPKNMDAALELLADDYWGLAWRALTGFVQRPYFTRLWIVQEVALAGNIILTCGDSEGDWDSFVLIVAALVKETYVYATNKERPHESVWDWTGNAIKDWEVPDGHFKGWYEGTRCIMMLQLARESVGKVSMKNFLAMMNGRGVTDPCDSVFSILDMAKGAKSVELNIDFGKNAVDVYLDATESIIRTTRSLDIICHSNWSEEHGHAHSWIPRFAGGFGSCYCEAFLVNSLTISEILVPDGGTRQEIMMDSSPYNASGGMKAEVVFDKSNRKMLAKGMVIEQITKVLDLAVPYRGGIAIPKQWRDVAMSFKPADTIGDISNEERVRKNFETFWRILVVNREQLQIHAGETKIDFDSISDNEDIFSYDSGRLYHEYHAPAPSEWGDDCAEWIEGDMTVPDSSTSGFMKGIVGYIRSKRYITMSNTMGLGPEGAKEGDIVCVLLGCSVPVVLRPTKEPNEYHFVGEAYIHGSMDGEAMHRLRAGEYELKVFGIT